MPKTPSRLKNNHFKQSGFTLLEFVTVVALVGFALAVIGLSLGYYWTKSRDMKRISHVAEIKTALAIYETYNKKFPVLPQETTITGTDDLSRMLEGDLILKITPVDPLHPVYSYTYLSSDDGSDYVITFCLETNSVREYKKGCNNVIRP